MKLRETLGLTAAEDGDVHGVVTFVRFINRELAVLQMAPLPDPIRKRLSALRGDADRLAEFADGYCEACGND